MLSLLKELCHDFNLFTARVDDGVCEMVLTFTSVDKILGCDLSNETLEVLSCGVICFRNFYNCEIWDFCGICLWSYLALKGFIKI